MPSSGRTSRTTWRSAPADDLMRKRLADRLWSALDRQPIDQRVVFALREILEDERDG